MAVRCHGYVLVHMYDFYIATLNTDSVHKLFNSFQILQFMRNDRRATARGHSCTEPCINFVIRDVFEALSKKGNTIKPEHFGKRVQHFPISTTNPQWFLKKDSNLDYIPSTKSRLAIHGKSRKCCHICQSVFKQDIIAALIAGLYETIYLGFVSMLCRCVAMYMYILEIVTCSYRTLPS